MKQVKRRTWFCLLFTLLLTVGLGIFLMRYTTSGERWASFSANKHIYAKDVECRINDVILNFAGW